MSFAKSGWIFQGLHYVMDDFLYKRIAKINETWKVVGILRIFEAVISRLNLNNRLCKLCHDSNEIIIFVIYVFTEYLN